MGLLLRLGLSRGLLGGSRLFTALGAVALAVRLAQKLSGTGPRTLYTHKLRNGEALVVTDK